MERCTGRDRERKEGERGEGCVKKSFELLVPLLLYEQMEGQKEREG